MHERAREDVTSKEVRALQLQWRQGTFNTGHVVFDNYSTVCCSVIPLGQCRSLSLSEAKRKSEGRAEEVEKAKEKEEVREVRWKIKI